MSENNQQVTISRRDVKRMGKSAGNAAGQAAGNAVAEQVNPELENIKSEIGDLQDDIQNLENRLVEIEEAKAAAEREAKEDIQARLKERYDQKKQEYQSKKQEVLGAYQQGIRRIKDRFVSSISGQKSTMDQVDDEFEDLTTKTAQVVDGTSRHSSSITQNYRKRRQRLENSRADFSGAVDEFLADREGTAKTVNSLKTGVPGIDGITTVNIPFWVVGIERNGQEELRVYPVMQRGQPDHQPRPDQPYAPYLRYHPDHDYQDFIADVKSYVQRDHVRDQLAQEQQYADPSFLARLNGVSDRFLDALRSFELAPRERQTESSAQTDPPRDRTQQEVATHD